MSRVRKRIAVALSGGVDSAVAAWQLLAAGFELQAFTLRLLPQTGRFADCGGQGAVFSEAAEIARRLGIAHQIVDESEAFVAGVLKPFLELYRRGETPNPCFLCNPQIKFGRLLEEARRLGCEGLATGHYAALADQPQTGRRLLLRPRDRNKDQTYFLAGLDQAGLQAAVFPLAQLEKEEVRALARRQDLLLDKRDSQDLCFLPDGDLQAFLSRELGRRPGPIVNLEGQSLGQHEGIWHYTPGQRRGLGVGGQVEPLYVVRLEPARNTVVVGPEAALYHDRLLAVRPNWILFPELDRPREVSASLRSTQRAVAAEIRPCPAGVDVRFVEPQRAPSPGQAIVFYEGERVVGGATIAGPPGRVGE